MLLGVSTCCSATVRTSYKTKIVKVKGKAKKTVEVTDALSAVHTCGDCGKTLTNKDYIWSVDAQGLKNEGV